MLYEVITRNKSGVIVAKTETQRVITSYSIHYTKLYEGDSSLIETVIVEAGADAADDRIVEMLTRGDLVITADIPLADRVLSKEAHAIDHRGERYTPDNIKQYLAMRNLMETIRDSGVVTGGPKPFGPKDAHAFANALHRFLTELGK